MYTHPDRKPTTKLSIVFLLGLLAACVFGPAARGAEQPKPGPEHKKLEAYVGEWTYEGSGVTTPFFPAGKFKGKSTARMVLGGFFLEGREEDKGEDGYLYQSFFLRGYDPVAKTYIHRGFENDGTVTSDVVTLNGSTWTALGSRSDKQGKVYKTRDINSFSPDGKSFTFSADYSADDGKTWLPMWKGTMTRSRK